MLDIRSELLRSELQRPSATGLAMLVLAAATATILAALAFEHIGGYDPCALCLQQRYAYYVGIPATVAALALLLQVQPKAAAVVLLAVGVGFLVNAGLGVYQAGAEWKLWDPPSTCAAAAGLPTFDAGSLSIDRVPALCGVASWRFLGLSFAGWNAVISAALAGGALTAALKAIRKPG
ncbi:MAG: disulfide bond formation protein B [Hyphomicrobiaceae bacterium]